MDPRVLVAGRASAGLVEKLRDEIRNQKSSAFLPTERELAERYGFARKTVAKALKILEAEGMLMSTPRQGRRVLSRGGRADRGSPLGYVRATEERPEAWQGLHGILLPALQELAAQKGWSLLALTSLGRSSQEVFEQLRAARVWGVVLDEHDPALIDLAHAAGIPTILVDNWQEDAGIDCVLQDGFMGGMQAANYLASRGHRDIAWLGPIGRGFQSQERFGGAVAGLAGHGLELPPERRFSPDYKQLDEVAQRVLTISPRPTGVIALWSYFAVAVNRAARRLGLEPGRDVEVVGWTNEEEYETVFLKYQHAGRVPPAVVWRVRSMAEAAVMRLEDRREQPDLTPMVFRIPTRIRFESSSPHSPEPQAAGREAAPTS